MRFVKSAVRPILGRRRHGTGGGSRTDHFVMAGERGGKFDADFKVDFAVQVDRDMPARSLDLLGADDAPNLAARIGDDAGEFVSGRASANDGERETRVLFESDVVFHVDHPVRYLFGFDSFGADDSAFAAGLSEELAGLSAARAGA